MMLNKGKVFNQLNASGDDVTMLASMVKLKAGRLARQVTDNCLQYFGGMGFTNEVFFSFNFQFF